MRMFAVLLPMCRPPLRVLEVPDGEDLALQHELCLSPVPLLWSHGARWTPVAVATRADAHMVPARRPPARRQRCIRVDMDDGGG
jgi:hypothetical protein